MKSSKKRHKKPNYIRKKSKSSVTLRIFRIYQSAQITQIGPIISQGMKWKKMAVRKSLKRKIMKSRMISLR